MDPRPINGPAQSSNTGHRSGGAGRGFGSWLSRFREGDSRSPAASAAENPAVPPHAPAQKLEPGDAAPRRSLARIRAPEQPVEVRSPEPVATQAPETDASADAQLKRRRSDHLPLVIPPSQPEAAVDTIITRANRRWRE